MLLSFQQPQEEGCSDTHVIPQSGADRRHKAPAYRAEPGRVAQGTLPALATTGSSHCRAFICYLADTLQMYQGFNI